ncbi:tetratricopeptide repeat protein [Candidatus Riflebacteria bacterium]
MSRYSILPGFLFFSFFLFAGIAETHIEAAPFLVKYLGTRKTEHRFLAGIALANFNKGDFKRAHKNWRKIFKTVPNSIAVNWALAYLYFQIGKNKLAKKHFARVKGINLPKKYHPHYRWNQFVLLATAGKVVKARKALSGFIPASNYFFKEFIKEDFFKKGKNSIAFLNLIIPDQPYFPVRPLRNPEFKKLRSSRLAKKLFSFSAIGLKSTNKLIEKRLYFRAMIEILKHIEQKPNETEVFKKPLRTLILDCFDGLCRDLPQNAKLKYYYVLSLFLNNQLDTALTQYEQDRKLIEKSTYGKRAKKFYPTLKKSGTVIISIIPGSDHKFVRKKILKVKRSFFTDQGIDIDYTPPDFSQFNVSDQDDFDAMLKVLDKRKRDAPGEGSVDYEFASFYNEALKNYNFDYPLKDDPNFLKNAAMSYLYASEMKDFFGFNKEKISNLRQEVLENHKTNTANTAGLLLRRHRARKRKIYERHR